MEYSSRGWTLNQELGIADPTLGIGKIRNQRVYEMDQSSLDIPASKKPLTLSRVGGNGGMVKAAYHHAKVPYTSAVRDIRRDDLDSQ